MTEKKMVSAKIASRTAKRLDQYADNEGISRSQAIDRMVKQGLDVEESDMRLVPVRADGGTEIEDQLSQMNNEIKTVKASSKNSDLMLGILTISIIWIGFELVYGFPTLFTISSGVVLIASLVYTLWNSEVFSNE